MEAADCRDQRLPDFILDTGPLEDMSKKDLIQLCRNLETIIQRKEEEIEQVNKHMEYILSLYYDTESKLAEKRKEVLNYKAKELAASLLAPGAQGSDHRPAAPPDQPQTNNITETQEGGSTVPAQHEPITESETNGHHAGVHQADGIGRGVPHVGEHNSCSDYSDDETASSISDGCESDSEPSTSDVEGCDNQTVAEVSGQPDVGNMTTNRVSARPPSDPRQGQGACGGPVVRSRDVNGVHDVHGMVTSSTHVSVEASAVGQPEEDGRPIADMEVDEIMSPASVPPTDLSIGKHNNQLLSPEAKSKPLTEKLPTSHSAEFTRIPIAIERSRSPAPTKRSQRRQAKATDKVSRSAQPVLHMRPTEPCGRSLPVSGGGAPIWMTEGEDTVGDQLPPRPHPRPRPRASQQGAPARHGRPQTANPGEAPRTMAEENALLRHSVSCPVAGHSRQRKLTGRELTNEAIMESESVRWPYPPVKHSPPATPLSNSLSVSGSPAPVVVRHSLQVQPASRSPGSVNGSASPVVASGQHMPHPPCNPSPTPAGASPVPPLRVSPRSVSDSPLPPNPTPSPASFSPRPVPSPSSPPPPSHSPRPVRVPTPPAAPSDAPHAEDKRPYPSDSIPELDPQIKRHSPHPVRVSTPSSATPVSHSDPASELNSQTVSHSPRPISSPAPIISRLPPSLRAASPKAALRQSSVVGSMMPDSLDLDDTCSDEEEDVLEVEDSSEEELEVTDRDELDAPEQGMVGNILDSLLVKLGAPEDLVHDSES